MIDWFNLAANALWILGCSVALAVVSYASWLASVQGIKFGEAIRTRSMQIYLYLAGGLVFLGFAGTSDSVLERAFMIVGCLFFWGQFVWLLFRTPKSSQ